MRSNGKTTSFLVPLFTVAMICVLYAEGWAAEELSAGRRFWDKIMLFVNFGILVALFLRYARGPLMKFLRGERTKLEGNFRQENERLEELRSDLEAQRARLTAFGERSREIQAGILELGRREKETLIEQGRIAAEKMVEKARIYAAHRIASARKVLAGEMVEAAVGIVEDKLSKALSEEDNEKLIHQFLSDLKSHRQTG